MRYRIGALVGFLFVTNNVQAGYYVTVQSGAVFNTSSTGVTSTLNQTKTREGAGANAGLGVRHNVRVTNKGHHFVQGKHSFAPTFKISGGYELDLDATYALNVDLAFQYGRSILKKDQTFSNRNTQENTGANAAPNQAEIDALARDLQSTSIIKSSLVRTFSMGINPALFYKINDDLRVGAALGIGLGKVRHTVFVQADTSELSTGDKKSVSKTFSPFHPL